MKFMDNQRVPHDTPLKAAGQSVKNKLTYSKPYVFVKDKAAEVYSKMIDEGNNFCSKEIEDEMNSSDRL